MGHSKILTVLILCEGSLDCWRSNISFLSSHNSIFHSWSVYDFSPLISGYFPRLWDTIPQRHLVCLFQIHGLGRVLFHSRHHFLWCWSQNILVSDFTVLCKVRQIRCRLIKTFLMVIWSSYVILARRKPWALNIINKFLHRYTLWNFPLVYG